MIEDRSIYRLGGSRPQGFAAWSVEKRRLIAAKGGRAAHALGRAYTFSSEEAQAAGSVGGTRSRRGPVKKKVPA